METLPLEIRFQVLKWTDPFDFMAAILTHIFWAASSKKQRMEKRTLAWRTYKEGSREFVVKSIVRAVYLRKCGNEVMKRTLLDMVYMVSDKKIDECWVVSTTLMDLLRDYGDNNIAVVQRHYVRYCKTRSYEMPSRDEMLRFLNIMREQTTFRGDFPLRLLNAANLFV